MSTRTVGRPEADEIPSHYVGYIKRVPELDPVMVCAAQIEVTEALLHGLSKNDAMYRYERGKWSVKEVVGHLADVERIMAYRALRIARGDTTPLPGFDENAYVPAAKFDSRSLADLVGSSHCAGGDVGAAAHVRRRRLAAPRHCQRQAGQRPRARLHDSRPRAASRRHSAHPLRVGGAK
jgi:hypothetical protein